METRKSKRSLRLALVMGAAVAGTALVGWGGLAAWQAYTQNAGNAFAAGSVTHTNLVGGTGHLACSATNAVTTNCDVIVSGSGLDYNWAGTSNTVTITDTGSLPSTFTLSTPSGDAPSGGLCADLSLTVTGLDSANAYVNQAGIGPIAATTLKTSAGLTSWAQTNSNTFTFAVNPSGTFATSGAGLSCSFDVLFTQAG